MSNNAEPVATESGNKISDNSFQEGKKPYWVDEKGEKTLLEHMDVEELVDCVENIEFRVNKHRDKILSHQQSIVKLLEVKNNLASELGKRDIPSLLIPHLEIG